MDELTTTINFLERSGMRLALAGMAVHLLSNTDPDGNPLAYEYVRDDLLGGDDQLTLDLMDRCQAAQERHGDEFAYSEGETLGDLVEALTGQLRTAGGRADV